MSILDKIKPLTPGQEKLLNALKSKDCDIVGVFGPTGTGKSLLSCAYGISAIMNNEYERFVIARPVVDITTGKEYTSVELGDLFYSMAGEYLRDILTGWISDEELNKLKESGKIIIVDPHFLRGRTFDNTIILLDDVQSVVPEVVCEIIMRIGRNSKLIIAGDPILQKDPSIEKDSATLSRELLLGEEKAIVIDLGLKDIVRPGARKGVRLALEMRMRKRPLSDSERKILDSIKVHAPDADVITVVEFKEEKEKFEIKAENVPEALVVVKEEYLGRVVGKGGERIQAVEKDVGLKIRCIELTLDLRNLITAIHPVPWINKHIVDTDFAGSELQVLVRQRAFGAFIGLRGSNIRFVDSVMKKLMKIGVRALEAEELKKPKKRSK